MGLDQRHQESKPVHTDYQPIGKEKHGGWGAVASGWWMSRTRPLHTSANHERRTKKNDDGAGPAAGSYGFLSSVHLLGFPANREWKQGNSFFFFSFSTLKMSH